MPVTNTRQLITVLRPTTTAEQQLYAVPSNTEMDGLLRICNQDSVQRTFRVAHCTAGQGDNDVTNHGQWIFYDKSLAANDTYELSIHAKSTETIRVVAGVADKISFHLSGNLKVIS